MENKVYNYYTSRKPLDKTQRKNLKKIKDTATSCDCCGSIFDIKNNIELDHIVPITLTGSRFCESNIATICRQCHKKKTNYDKKIIAAMKTLNLITKVSINQYVSFEKPAIIEHMYHVLYDLVSKTNQNYLHYISWEHNSERFEIVEYNNN